MNKYLKLYILTLIFCLGFSYSAFFISSNTSQSWTSKVDSNINSIDISENDKYIVVGTSGGYVYLFHKNNPNPIQIYNFNNEVKKVDICSDGRFIIVGITGKLLLLNQTSSEILREFIISNGATGSFSFSDNGEYIVTGSSYSSSIPGSVDKLYLFDRNNSIPIWELSIPVKQTAITSKGDYFIINGGSNGLSLFSILNNTPHWTFNPHPIRISMSNDGDLIAIGEGNGYLYIFNKESAIPLWNYQFDYSPNPVITSSDGSHILTVSNNIVYLFNKDSSIPLWTYEVIGDSPSADISLNGDFLAIAMDLPPWETSRSKVYIFNKFLQAPIWSRGFDGFTDNTKIGFTENYVVVGINADFHNTVYKIDFMTLFSDFDFIQAIFYILMYLGIPCTLFVSISFFAEYIIKKRKYVKKIILEEEKLNKEFHENLTEQFERWEKQEDKKYENND